MDIKYIPNFISDPDKVLETLVNELDWVKRGNTPRMEYYVSKFGFAYTYGTPPYEREYPSQAKHPLITFIEHALQVETDSTYEVCFLNRYEDQSDHLGWHADDSPEMDDTRPICIVSLGVEREIWFRPNGSKDEVTKLKLENGSLCIMPAGFQDTHQHRIPKASFMCGRRISLTYRGYTDDSV
jgi:alkylated DNA repair dioxygenase AlkB